MPWCPNCNMEYREGVTHCSDCKVPLVDELPKEAIWVTLVEEAKEDFINKLKSYLEYSNVRPKVFVNEENQTYGLQVEEKDIKEAKKLYRAFYTVEAEKAVVEQIKSKLESQQQEAISEETDEPIELEADNQEDFEENHEEACETFATYVMKSDRYKDNKSTGWLFLFFSLAGLTFVVLNLLNIIPFLNTITCVFMSILFIIFLIVAFMSFHKAKELSSQILEEDQLTEDINQFLKETVTMEYLESLKDETVTEEINYFQNIIVIKELLKDRFGEQNPAYIDRLVEEYYNKTFEN